MREPEVETAIEREQRAATQPLEATLLLADGTSFQGRGLGPETTASGELVFTTAMTGYQEALTDPSYRGQMLMFTYPQIGNYGVAPGRAQSSWVQAGAVIVATMSDPAIGEHSLGSYLAEYGVPTMYDVDTRSLTLHIRRHGAMPAALSVHPAGCEPPVSDLRRVLDASSYDTQNLVRETTSSEREIHGAGSRRIVLLDCGNKRRVIEELVRRDVEVTVLPAFTRTSDILALSPQGVVISNGPGNPAAVGPVIDTIRDLMGVIPLFGICLGHQLLALAAGGNTYKLKFGHRGANHPVKDCSTGRAFVTTQNHGYAVDEESLPPDLLVSHRNLNDGTVEGLCHRTLPIRSVQFHPEGAPGPKDAGIVLDEWLDLAA